MELHVSAYVEEAKYIIRGLSQQSTGLRDRWKPCNCTITTGPQTIRDSTLFRRHYLYGFWRCIRVYHASTRET